MRLFTRAPALLLVLTMSFAPAAVPAQSTTPEVRIKEITAQRRLISSVREIEALSRELYFDQSFILLYLHGERTEWIGSYNEPPRMLTQAVESRIVPPVRRFGSRLDRMAISDEHRSLLSEVVSSIDVAIEAGYEMAGEIREDDLDGATALFHERSLPAFKSAWRGLYTVLSELEKAVPKR